MRLARLPVESHGAQHGRRRPITMPTLRSGDHRFRCLRWSPRTRRSNRPRTYKRGFRFRSLCAFVEYVSGGTGEPLAITLRPGNAGANTAADHIAITRPALTQLPSVTGSRPGKRVLVRTDSAGGTHEFLNYLTAPAVGVLGRFRADRDQRHHHRSPLPASVDPGLRRRCHRT